MHSALVKKMDRKKRAELYKAKSDESYAAAQLCFKNSLFRAACNRAWYSTMQIITAGVYLETDERPPTDQPNFSHASQCAGPDCLGRGFNDLRWRSANHL